MPALSSPPLSLPPELHHLIISHLPYPDALALKHTSLYFYYLVDTRDYRPKVSWIVDRQTRGLACPKKSCIFKTDAAFCSSGAGEVRRIMERRRRHEECGKDGVCEVLVGRRCEVARRTAKRKANESWLLERAREIWGLEWWTVGVMLLALVICVDYTLLLRSFDVVWERSGTGILTL
jgi:hypothetical protein